MNPHEKKLEQLWNHADDCPRAKPLELDEPCKCGLPEALALIKSETDTRVEFDMRGQLQILDLDRHTLILLTSDQVNRQGVQSFYKKVCRADPRWKGKVFHLKPGEDVEHLPGEQTYAFYRSLMAQFNPPLHEAHVVAERATQDLESAKEASQGVGVEIVKRGEDFHGKFVPVEGEEEEGGAREEIPERPRIPDEEQAFRNAAWERGECVACAFEKAGREPSMPIAHSCHKKMAPEKPRREPCTDPTKMNGYSDQFGGTDEGSHYDLKPLPKADGSG